MIEESQTTYYISYALICAAVGLAYLKFKSTEGAVITTKEFQVFQTGFLTGYSVVILCELIAAASFYHTFVSMHLSLEQITKLYIATIAASTATGIVTEIVDVGARKDKCVLAALLYSISMFSIFFGGHFEMLLLGRLVYGAASSLHHQCFENYAVHQHASRGFPEDWLGHTFSLLTHCMALVAAVSGVLGQIAASTGTMGPPALCCAMFAVSAGYMAVAWEKDLNSPRFMLGSFVANVKKAHSAVSSNRQMLCLVAVSSLVETSILIFSFYWAPWMSLLRDDGQHLPSEIVFSCFVLASMLGNYCFQMFSPTAGIEGTFQGILLASSALYLLGAMVGTAGFAFLVGVLVQGCMGGYWPSIGYLRGRIVPPELRNTVLIAPKVITVLLTVLLLHWTHHLPLLLLSACAALNAAAAYIQGTYMDTKSLLAEEEEDSSDEED